MSGNTSRPTDKLWCATPIGFSVQLPSLSPQHLISDHNSLREKCRPPVRLTVYVLLFETRCCVLGYAVVLSRRDSTQLRKQPGLQFTASTEVNPLVTPSSLHQSLTVRLPGREAYMLHIGPKLLPTPCSSESPLPSALRRTYRQREDFAHDEPADWPKADLVAPHIQQ